MNKIKQFINKARNQDKFQNLSLIIILLLLAIVFGSIQGSFFSIYNIQNIFKQVSINGLIAYGMAFVILLGLIDLSVGSILSFTAYVVGILIVKVGVNPYLSILLGLALGGTLGFINGLLVSKVKLQPFIATLATMTILRGLTKVISKGLPVRELEEHAKIFTKLNGNIWIFPVSMIILILLFIITSFVLNKTVYGKHIYATGGNEEAARLSTINTDKIKISVYVISGVLSALAAILYLSRYNSVYPDAGTGMELDAIAAVVIGGMSMSGGRGKMSGTFLGILIIGVMNNGLNLIGLSSVYQEVVKGLVILIAVVVDNYKRKNNVLHVIKESTDSKQIS